MVEGAVAVLVHATARSEQGVLARRRPLAGEAPLVELQPVSRSGDSRRSPGGGRGRSPASAGSLGRLRLDAVALDRDEIAHDTEEPLDEALRLLVAAFAELDPPRRYWWKYRRRPQARNAASVLAFVMTRKL